MTDVLRIKRRALGGAAGAPSSLAVGELAFNEQDAGLYIGRSNGSVVQINSASSDPYALKSNVTATLAVGYTITPYNLGNISSFTLIPSLGNYQYGTNWAAATWTAPSVDCAMDVLVTNGATAASITFSGFTVGPNTGDALTLANGQKFIISIRRINGISTYTIKALQ